MSFITDLRSRFKFARRLKLAGRGSLLKSRLGGLRMARTYYIIAIMAGVAMVAGAFTYRSSGEETRLVAADFNDGDQNNLGGKLNVYQRAPSAADKEFVTTQRRGSFGRALRIHADRQPEGFCGMWMHFFDMDAVQPEYMDTNGFRYLSFWVKGEQGGEEFTVKLADKKWIAKQDSIAVGAITDFLPGGVTTEWQQVLVPLHTNDLLAWNQLGGLSLDFDKSGSYTVYLDDVCFVRGVAAGAPVRVPLEIIRREPAVVELEPEIILQPAAGDRVERVEEIRGNLVPGQHAVVLVRCAQPNSPWWIQEEIERSGQHSFRSRARFGNEKTLPGTEFQAVVILPPTAEAARQFRVGETLKMIPDGVPHSKVLEVVSK